METANLPELDSLIAERLKALRLEQAWSLDELAQKSGISRASLSRLENAEVSATATVLGKLCACYGLPISRLMRMVEQEFIPLVTPKDQPVWVDPDNGFERRSLSPPAKTLAGEALSCKLLPGTRIHYERPPRDGLEHHLVMQEGELHLSVDGRSYVLHPGDCLRYQLHGPSTFSTGENLGARYLIFII